MLDLTVKKRVKSFRKMSENYQTVIPTSWTSNIRTYVSELKKNHWDLWIGTVKELVIVKKVSFFLVLTNILTLKFSFLHQKTESLEEIKMKKKNAPWDVAENRYLDHFLKKKKSLKTFKEIQNWKKRKTIGGQAEVPLIATNVNRAMLNRSLKNKVTKATNY